MRAAIKAGLIGAYCNHWIPAWSVTFAFRALRLEAI